MEFFLQQSEFQPSFVSGENSIAFILMWFEASNHRFPSVTHTAVYQF
jgi:hypothetical protein